MSAGWGRDPEKWLIKNWGNCWNVYPPTGSFWGKMTTHDTGEDALADFRRQTTWPKPEPFDPSEWVDLDADLPEAGMAWLQPGGARA